MSKRALSVVTALLLVLLAVTLSASAGAPATQDGPMIHLVRATFDPLANEPALTTVPAALQQPVKDAPFYLLQFEGPVQEAWKADIEAAGFELLSYIPDHAFIVRLRDGAVAAAGALPHVRWIGAYLPIYKIEPSLDARMDEAEPLLLTAQLFRGEQAALVAPLIESLGGAVEDTAGSDLIGDALRITMPANRIADLALAPAVAWIEPALPMQVANDKARTVMQVNSAWTTLAARGINLYGAGQIIDVSDTGLDTGNASTLSLDFRDRFIKSYAVSRPGLWNDPCGHGTHVAGSALGSGRNSGSNPPAHSYGTSFAGVAPEAALIFQSLTTADCLSIQTPADLKALFGPAHTDGARIHTNSWGHPTGGIYPNYTYGGYDSASAYSDEFMWLNPASLLLYAAGNAGVDANADGVIDLDRLLSPATAKNALTVGATENNRPPASGFGGYTNNIWGVGSWESKYPVNPIHDDYISNNIAGMAAFSSRGPTDDGRSKPEVVSPGTDVISARSSVSGASVGWGVHNSAYIYNGGTSMATPLTAGAAALVRQFYTDVQRLSNPSAALVKATLINGAANIAPGQYGEGATREIPATVPNNVIGFGRISLSDSLALNGETRLVYWDAAGGLATGSAMTYTVYVTTTTPTESDLIVTLCWTDFPATVGAAKALVNDLDLQMIAPDGTQLLGNGKAVWDRLNNTEQVRVHAPQAGAYRVIVRGASVPQGPQPYALVASAPYLTTSPNLGRRAWLPMILRHAGGSLPTSTPTATRPTATPTPTRTPTPTPTRTATPLPAAPLAGIWKNEDESIEFYVTADQAHVDDFAVHITVDGCGSYKIVHSQSEPITMKAFSFLGEFFASGTFITSMTSAGTAGLNNYYIAGCGYVTGGPWDFAAVWRGWGSPPADAPAMVESDNAQSFRAYRASK